MSITWSQGTLNIATSIRSWNQIIWATELGLFIAVASLGTGTNRAATSADGVTWTAHALTANGWNGVAWNGSIAVTVSDGATNRVMTSTDGLSWTGRSASEANSWLAVCWDSGHSVFVAVASTGTHRVMTSPDGINWTNQTASSARSWNAIAYSSSLNMLVAGNSDGVTTAFMTSTDGGVTWADQTIGSASAIRNNSITWSSDLGMFAAGGTGPKLWTSTNGTSWTNRGDVANGNNVSSIAWSAEQGLFFALGAGRDYSTSSDGITWAASTQMSDGVHSYNKGWLSVAYSPTVSAFVVVLGADVAGITAIGAYPLTQSLSPASGIASAGTAVTINGDGRNGGFINGGGHTYWVFFGNLSSYAAALTAGSAPIGNLGIQGTSLTYVGAHQMTCLAPVGKGASDVAIVDQSTGVNNVVFYMAAGYTFISPTIASVLPVSGINTGGTPLTVTGSNMFVNNIGSGPGNLYCVFSNGTTKVCTSPVQVGTTTFTCLTPAYDPSAARLVDLRYDPPTLDAGIFGIFSYASSTLVGAYTFVVPQEGEVPSGSMAGSAAYDMAGSYLDMYPGETLTATAAMPGISGSGVNAHIDVPIDDGLPLDADGTPKPNLRWELERFEMGTRREQKS